MVAASALIVTVPQRLGYFGTLAWNSKQNLAETPANLRVV